MLRILITLAIGIAFLAYFLYIPIPEEMKSSHRMRFMLMVHKAFYSGVYVGEKLGFWKQLTAWRFLTNNIMMKEPELANDSHVTVTEATFDGIEVLITLPVGASKPLPALVYFHGGGFVILNARQYFPITAELTKRLQVAVFSVNYRLAPENPFPIPFQDCVSATIYLLKNAAAYNVDPLKISVIGDSAGGNLAAAVALKLREHPNLPALKSQVLIYPFIQAFDFSLPSHQQNSEFLLSPQFLSFFTLSYFNKDLSLIPSLAVNNHTSPELKKSKYSHYIDVKFLPERFTKTNYIRSKDNFGDVILSKQLESYILNPFAFPLMADNLQGLPQALVLLCRFDALRDEGLLYAHRLREAGVKVNEYIVENGIHGSLNAFRTSDTGKETIDAIINYLQKL